MEFLLYDLHFEETIFEFLELVIGEKGEKVMKKRKRNKRDKDGYEYNFDGVNYKNLRTVPPPPGMPSPEEIAKMMKNAKVTIILDEDTVDFFKKTAKKHGTKYQKMIREILKTYRIECQKRAA